MTAPPLDTSSQRRITPGRDADELARATYTALLTDLAELTQTDWRRPTDCTGWTVRDMVAHLVGAAEGHGSLPIFVSQYTWGVRHRKDFGGSGLDAMNQKQINDQQALDDAALTARLVDLAPRAVTGRSRRTRWMGWAPISLDQAGSWYAGMPTRTTMGELCAVVLTRDVWAHRLDLARALGKPPTIDPRVDGRVVADIVADWAERHALPFTLVLTGEAGGTFRSGHSGPSLTLDALDFARLMAGRRPDGDIPHSPLLDTKVLF
jgi:uncharacterized protein (TIGR03083 family)